MYIIIAVIGLTFVLFMFGALRLAGEADRQSEAIGKVLRRASDRDRGDEAQDNAIDNAAGPRKVKPV